VTVDGATAQVHRWARCDGTAIAFDEVTFVPSQRDFGVYVQIRQVDSQDRTDAVLSSLRIRGSLAPQALQTARVPVRDVTPSPR